MDLYSSPYRTIVVVPVAHSLRPSLCAGRSFDMLRGMGLGVLAFGLGVVALGC